MRDEAGQPGEGAGARRSAAGSPTPRWSPSCRGCTPKGFSSAARPGAPTCMRRSPTSPGWQLAGWPGCWTARPTGRRSWPGSCPACRVPMRNCCAGCSATRRVRPTADRGGLQMHLAVYFPLVMPLLAAAAAGPLAGRLPPAAATWLLAGSAIVLAAASSAVLGLLALTALVRIPLVGAAGEMSVQVISRDDPAPVPVAAVAGVLLAAAAAGACRALWHRTAALIAAGRQARRLPGAGQVVVTDDEAADAYTLPGWPCRIVVTAAARLAAAANPLLRPVAAAVGYTVERWADERAAAITGDRPLAARAIARAALAATAGPPRRAGPAAALAAVARPRGMRGAGPVPRRVAALLGPPPQPRLLLVAAAVLLVAVAGASALEAARDLNGLLELARAAGPS